MMLWKTHDAVLQSGAYFISNHQYHNLSLPQAPPDISHRHYRSSKGENPRTDWWNEKSITNVSPIPEFTDQQRQLQTGALLWNSKQTLTKVLHRTTRGRKNRNNNPRTITGNPEISGNFPSYPKRMCIVLASFVGFMRRIAVKTT